MNRLEVIVNNEAVFDFDKPEQFEDSKLAFLDDMDQGMSRGIKLQGKHIDSPDSEQRLRFVALNLIKALQQQNPAVIQASCSYLVTRLPGLIELHVNDVEDRIDIEFIEQALN